MALPTDPEPPDSDEEEVFEDSMDFHPELRGHSLDSSDQNSSSDFSRVEQASSPAFSRYGTGTGTTIANRRWIGLVLSSVADP
jgi:hypothetical protein